MAQGNTLVKKAISGYQQFTSNEVEGRNNPPLQAAVVKPADKTTVNSDTQASKTVQAGKEIRAKTSDFIKQEDLQPNKKQKLEGASACDHSPNTRLLLKVLAFMSNLRNLYSNNPTHKQKIAETQNQPNSQSVDKSQIQETINKYFEDTKADITAKPRIIHTLVFINSILSHAADHKVTTTQNTNSSQEDGYSTNDYFESAIRHIKQALKIRP